MATLEEKLNELKYKFTDIISLLLIPSTQKQIVIPTINFSQFTPERVDITKTILKQYNKDIDIIVKLSGIYGIIKLIRQLFRIKLSQDDISIILEEIIEPFKPSKNSSQMYLNTLENFKKIVDFRIMYLITERGLEKQRFNAVIYIDETKEIIPIDNFLRFCFFSNTIFFWFRIIKRESIIALKKILDIDDLLQVNIPNYRKNLNLKLIDFEKLIANVPLNWFHPEAQKKINNIIIKYKEESITTKEKELEEIREFSEEEEEPEWKEEEAKAIPEEEEKEEEPEIPFIAYTLEEIKAKIEALDETNKELSRMLIELATDKKRDISSLELKKLLKEEKALMKLYKRELSVITRYSETHKELKERLNVFEKEINNTKKDTERDRTIYSKKIDKLEYAISFLSERVREMYFSLEGGKPFGLDPTESANAGLSLITQTISDLKKLLDENTMHKNFAKLETIINEYEWTNLQLLEQMKKIKNVDSLTEMPILIEKIKIFVTRLDSELTNFNEAFV